MHSIDILPNLEIYQAGPASVKFLELKIETFQEACHYVLMMPYGPNSRHEDSLILFREGQGTCITKHGAIALLAQELGLPVYKNLGFYRLDDSIVTGVSDILLPHGLSFIPQIHCFLGYGEYRVDLTEGNCNGKNKTIENYDFTLRVQPNISHEMERQYYCQFLTKYFSLEPALKQVGEVKILELVNACNRQVKYQCSLMAATGV